MIDFLEHHETNADRPKVLNHYIAVTAVTVGSLVIGLGTLSAIPQGLTLSTLIFTPMSWWFLKTAGLNSQSKPANIFYLDGLSSEEIERIQMTDAMEQLAFEMQKNQAYGLISRDQSSV